MKEMHPLASEEDKAVVIASGHLLTKHLPGDWFLWPESELDGFLEKYAWEPMENQPIENIWEVITDLANEIQAVYRRGCMDEDL